jgi:glyoxylase-like metal-dependent hydrolase (beta-lactamase superfamily II)
MQNTKLYAVICLVLIAAIPPAAAQVETVTVTEVSDRVIVLRACDSPLCSNVVAVRSARGIVVVDTGDRPQYAKWIRRAVERRFYCENIYCVINTHHVLDHTGGNEVFWDVPIIGHANWTAGMAHQDSLFASPQAREKAKQILAGVEEEVKTLTGDSSRRRLLTGVLDYYRDFFEMYPDGYNITYPNLRFREHMTIDLGDLTMELIHPGHLYSTSDILIYIPGEEIIIAGDVFEKERLPVVDNKSDIDKAIAAFDDMLGNGSRIKCVIPGHMDMLTLNEAREQRDYLKKLRSSVTDAQSQGISLEEAKTALSIQKRFPAYADYGRYSFFGLDADHERNIEAMWNIVMSN